MSKNNLSPLFLAQIKNDFHTIENIIKKGGDINERDPYGRTILMYASQSGQYDLVKLLLDSGADTKLKDSNGTTALHFAAMQFDTRIAELLLKNGANLEAQDANGNTPLNDAVFYSKGRGDMINFLLEKGADKNKENFHGVSPYKLAKTVANYDLKKFF